MHCEHQAVYFKHQLMRIRARLQMAFGYRLPDRPDQLAFPAGDDRDHFVALRSRDIVVLDRAGDHDAAARHLARQKSHPALQDRFEPR